MKNLLSFTLVFCLTLLACKPKQGYEYGQIEGFTQGTTYKISFENSTRKDYRVAIDSILKDFGHCRNTSQTQLFRGLMITIQL